MYKIKDTYAKTNVGKPYTSRTKANSKADKLNKEYGAHRYTVSIVQL